MPQHRVRAYSPLCRYKNLPPGRRYEGLLGTIQESWRRSQKMPPRIPLFRTVKVWLLAIWNLKRKKNRNTQNFEIQIKHYEHKFLFIVLCIIIDSLPSPPKRIEKMVSNVATPPNTITIHWRRFLPILSIVRITNKSAGNSTIPFRKKLK